MRFLITTMFLLLTQVGCITAYKTEIQQGNVITQEMMDKLRAGMTKSQVRFVLGTPLIADPFHTDRWDYLYLYKKNVNAPAETRQITVIFNGDTLSRVEDGGNIVALPSPSTPDTQREMSATPESTLPNPSSRAL